MASIFDQYENTLTKESPYNMNEHLSVAQNIVSFRTKEPPPIFTKQKLNLSLKNEITASCINNNWLVVLMSNQLIFRLNLADPRQQDDVLIEKFIHKSVVNGLFIDPLGAHVILTISPIKGMIGSAGPSILYLQNSSKKPRIIHRFKDHTITAVGFNWDNQSETNTGLILLGTSKGLIFEADIGQDQEKINCGSNKPIFEIDRADKSYITAIEFFRAPETNNYIVLVATVDRLYKFHETVKFLGETKISVAQQIFASYLNISENLLDYNETISKGSLSKLSVTFENCFPTSISWLTESGVLLLSDIDKTASSQQFISKVELLPIPDETLDQVNLLSNSHQPEVRLIPINIISTDYHILILFIDRIRAISILNYQVIYEEQFHEHQGKLLNIIKDQKANVIYLYTTKTIYRYKITQEDRNVWKLYLEKNEFCLALNHCRNNTAYCDIVLTKYAEHIYEKSNYVQSAKLFAKTQKSFEEVCLKFYEINEYEALLCYLIRKFDKLKDSDKTQITMLTIWIIELYITGLGKLSLQNQNHVSMQKELDKFIKLPKVKECISNNCGVIQELMANHGFIYDFATLQQVNQNHDELLQQYVNNENFNEAVQLLKAVNKQHLVYKFGPILMEEAPSETVNMFKNFGKRLEVLKLIPALSCIKSEKHIIGVIDYLEYCIHSLGCTNQNINNFLILLYSLYRKEKLLEFLESQGKDKDMINYDIYFALRAANENNIKAASVYLYCMLNLWQKAIELALKIDINLAIKTVTQVKDPKLKKRLWLLITKKYVESGNNIKKALKLLENCESLRLEDILQFFPDFDKIDNFKQAVCEALEKYDIKLQDQKKDMDDFVKSAEIIQNNLQNFRNHSIIISGTDVCAVCESTLLFKPFFLFSCNHKFHADCLEKVYLLNLPTASVEHVRKLKNQLNNANNYKSREKIKDEIDQCIVSSCIFCGEIMIEAIDKMFDTNWYDNY